MTDTPGHSHMEHMHQRGSYGDVRWRAAVAHPSWKQTMDGAGFDLDVAREIQ